MPAIAQQCGSGIRRIGTCYLQMGILKGPRHAHFLMQSGQRSYADGIGIIFRILKGCSFINGSQSNDKVLVGRRAILPEQAGVFAEPFFGFAVAREGGFDVGPEEGGVVHLLEVHEFVDDDVVADEDGRLDETPVEGNGFANGAGPPAGALVADGNAADIHAVLHGEFVSASGEFAGGEGAEAGFNGATEVVGWIEVELLVGEGDKEEGALNLQDG